MNGKTAPTPLAWRATSSPPSFTADGVAESAHRIRESVFLVQEAATGQLGVAFGGELVDPATDGALQVAGMLPPMYPEWLGDRTFTEAHGTRFAYVTGAMANGIATTALVIEASRAGCLGFFGAAGLSYERVSVAIDDLIESLGHDGAPWGCNLIHSPHEPELEEAVSQLYLDRGVRRVSAAAYLSLTPAIVRYAYSGIYVDASGAINRPNMVFAKISRPEVAQQFMNPAPAAIIDGLLSSGKLTEQEARLARSLPVAEDYTVEGDSGGHTDNRPLSALFSTIQAVRDSVTASMGYARALRLGAAGGIGTPQAVAAAFAMGASYVLTGTVNQACVESGLSAAGKEMLAKADIADVTMAPAADMFELGVDLQVLKRGTMFAPRAKQLFQLYRAYPSLDSLPGDVVADLESNVLGMTVSECWSATREFWMDRDANQVAKAEADARHKMALTFRSYLGLSSRWAIEGTTDRQMDYQIWCGPAMGAFNAWTKGTFLAEPHNRSVSQVAKNLLEGAAVLTRAHQLRTYGVPVPSYAFDFRPRRLD